MNILYFQGRYSSALSMKILSIALLVGENDVMMPPSQTPLSTCS